MAPVGLFLLHWADSEVARVVCEGDDVLIHLAAAQVLPLGEVPTGLGPPTVGHVRHLVLRLVQAGLCDTGMPLGDAIGRLSQGHLRWAGGAPAGTLAVPCAHDAPLQLALAFANGTPLDITASGLQAGFSGDPAYGPSLAC